MVGKPPPVTFMSAFREDIDPGQIADRMAGLPGIATVRDALAGERAFLVGGAVRDLLLGAPHPDLDVAVEGDAPEIARRLGANPVAHERFVTATVEVDGGRVDLAATRTEHYPRPGALPEVEPASLERDLARRDFTVNAMAIPLAGDPELIDPHDGLEDLRAGALSVLHPKSFADDPTRALRAARYAARLGFEIEPATFDLLTATDLGTVSSERIEAELRRIATEDTAPAAFELLAQWGLAGIDRGVGARIAALQTILARPEWSDLVDAPDAIYSLATPDPSLEAGAVRLSSATPRRPSEGTALARGRHPVELAAARVAGAGWLDDYVRDWRHVELEIDGSDLLTAGVPEGPAVGRGLAAALDAKLDGEVSGRDDELRVALAAATAS
jgi:tRNA nucleotidyltransferase (CCA-adding enzyme)